MSIEADLAIADKVATIALDIAEAFPGLGVPIGAVRAVGAVISLDEDAYSVLESPAGAGIRKHLSDAAKDVGLNFDIGGGQIAFETREEVQKDADAGVF